MIFRRTRSRRQTGRIVLSLASMIDVTFLLLAYFLLTTVLVRPEDRLSPNLAVERVGAGQGTDFEPQFVDVIMVDDGARFRIGERLFESRVDLLATLRELPKEAGLFVRVQDAVPVGFAASALQAGRDAGFLEVTYVPMP